MSTANRIPSKVKSSHWVWARQSTQAGSSNTDPSKIGKWMLFLDMKKRNRSGLTELDRTWSSIITLVEEKVLHGAKCSTAKSEGSSDKDTGVVICYTKDYTDKTRVREAADAIHRTIKLKSPIYYKTDEATRAGTYTHLGDKNVSIYRYCPDSTFYERGAGSSWIQIGDGGGSSESLIPSKVTWLRWLWAGPIIDPESSQEEELKSGKWLLFLNQEDEDRNGQTKLDKAWPTVARLVNEGILLSAKCCTAATPSYGDPTVGVIACYTPDYTDKKNVKEVVEVLHRSIKSLGTLYYKTDEASVERESTSTYMYRDCELYERDEESEWRLVVFD